MNKLTIGKKIAFGFLCLMAINVIAGAIGIWHMRAVAGRMESVSSEYLKEAELATQFEREILNARIFFIYFVTIQKPGTLDKGWQRFRQAEALLPGLEKVVTTSAELGALRSDVAQLTGDFAKYTVVLNKIITAVQQGHNQGPEFTALLTQWASLGGALVDTAGKLNARGEQLTSEASRLSAVALQQAIVWTGAGVAVSLGVGALIGFLVTGGINRILRGAVTQLNHDAQHITTSSRELASSSQTLSDGASKQAASLEETSASATEINSVSRRNAESAQSAAAMVADTQKKTTEATQAVELMETAMTEINAASNAILNVTKVVDGIAFQTNILALNAAVEAARAGEAGLGFAVVADEVRSLAQRCSEAVKETSRLIEDSRTKSVNGKARLDEVSSAVRTIASQSGQLATLVSEVSTGSQEQIRGLDQMATALSQIEQVTQRTAAAAEQSASAAKELSGQSENLTGIAEQLSDMVGGAARR